MLGVNIQQSLIYQEAKEEGGRSLVLCLLHRKLGTVPNSALTQLVKRSATEHPITLSSQNIPMWRQQCWFVGFRSSTQPTRAAIALDKVSRLYEGGADDIRVEDYVRRWSIWVRIGVDGMLDGLGLSGFVTSTQTTRYAIALNITIVLKEVYTT